MATKSLYPAPPSVYPRPDNSQSAQYETSYSRDFVRKEPKDADFYRSRTLNTTTIADSNNPSTYPRHGNGGYSLPYYRRDSKGFRAPFVQPRWVDDYYVRKSEWKRSQEPPVLASQTMRPSQFAHSSSAPNMPGPNDGASAQDMYGNGSNPSVVRPGDDSVDTLRRTILADPMLTDPLANAYRKSRTVYKRSFGACR